MDERTPFFRLHDALIAGLAVTAFALMGLGVI